MPHRDSAPVGAPCWVDIFSSDTAATTAFYTGLFGWTAEEPNADFGGYFNFQKDGVRIAGCMGNDGSMPDTWSVYLATADAKATEQAAAAHGAQVYAPAMEVGDLGSMLVLGDPGGAMIGAWQPGLHRGFQEHAEPNTPDWFELHTRDYDTAVAFYREVFGWETEVVADSPEFRYTALSHGDSQLAGIMDAGAWLPEGVPAHWSVYFGTADIDASIAKAVELGGTVVDPIDDTPYGRLATLTDPTGTRFKLRQS